MIKIQNTKPCPEPRLWRGRRDYDLEERKLRFAGGTTELTKTFGAILEKSK
jgi:hypothetical protein